MLRRVNAETGASAIMVAVGALLLFGMAAIAVDVGAAFNERRQDQTGADAGALAGGVETIRGKSLSEIVAQIKTTTQANLGRPSDWAACTDPDALNPLPAELDPVADGLDAAQPCISFGDSTDGVAYGRIRVRVPDQETDTAFGGIIGLDALTTSAQAEVELGSEGPYRNIPSFVFAPAVPGDEYCIRTGSGSGTPSPAETCEGSATGNFGLFLPYFYTDVGGLECVSGQQSAPNGFSIAEGLDHPLAADPTLLEPRRENGAECPAEGGPGNPNQIRFTSGNDPNVTDGLISGYSGPLVPNYDGRLTRRIWDPSTYGTATIFTEDIDNRPLWTYIDNDGGIPACVDAASGPTSWSTPDDPSSTDAFEQARADMIDCLQDPGVPDNLFDGDLYDSPRLATVPKLAQNMPCGAASCLYDIIDFVPVFIDSLWTSEGSQWTCDDAIIRDTVAGICRHDPGREGTLNVGAAGQRKLGSVSGVVLSCSVLHTDPTNPATPEQRCRTVGSGGSSFTTFLSQELVK